MSQLQNRTVLILDDEIEIAEILKEELELLGAIVQTAKNGTEGQVRFDSSSFDFVISDIRMPGGDGIDFLKKNKPARPNVLFTIMTGFSDIGSDEIYEMGASAIFSKPFDFESITQKLIQVSRPNSEKWAETETFIFPSNLPLIPDEASQGAIQMGNGGFFIPTGASFEIEKNINFKLKLHPNGQNLIGFGTIVWQRPKETDTHFAGIGVEINALEPTSLKEILQHLESETPIAFIPSGRK
jgi:DNA-binding response OmpR family regulator